MKKDELLDMITELRVDDAFVDEALGEQDGAPVRIYAGSVKKSPMRIAAPIAACLAVAAAAGFVFVNVSRGKLATGPATSIEESSEVDETSEPVIDEPETATFVDKCKEIVISELPKNLVDSAEWLEAYFDFDFDGEDELVLCLHNNPKPFRGVIGDRVFKNDDNGDVIDLGEIHSNDNVVHIIADNGDSAISDYIARFSYVDEVGKKCYFFSHTESAEKSTETVFEVYVNDNGVIEENAYLRFETTFPRDEASSTPMSEKAFIYGSEVSAEELLAEWRAIPNLPLVHGYYDKAIMIKIVDYLANNYNLTEEHYNDLMKIYTSGAVVHQDDPCAQIAVGGVDYDGDGRSETTVRFRNCPELLPGTYIFSTVNGEPKLLAVEDL